MYDKLFFITFIIVIKITFRHILQNCTIKTKLYKKTEIIVLHELFILTEKESPVISVTANRFRRCFFSVEFFVYQIHISLILSK